MKCCQPDGIMAGILAGQPSPRSRSITTFPGSALAAAGYTQLESDISRAIADDLSTFQSGATAGASAFGPLEGVVIVAALVMAGACAWGLSRRLGEYR